ncbi:Amino-alpha-acetyltransferase 2, partial [Hyphodiscus hymeniophilus]
ARIFAESSGYLELEEETSTQVLNSRRPVPSNNRFYHLQDAAINSLHLLCSYSSASIPDFKTTATTSDTYPKNLHNSTINPLEALQTHQFYVLFQCAALSPSINSTILQRLRSSLRFFHNSRARLNGKPTSPDPTPNLGSPPKGSPPEPTTLSGRMRKLSREYGWSAAGVYLGLTALDFPFCYLLVRWLGTDRIGEWEHIVVSNVENFIPDSVKQTWHDWRASMKKEENEIAGSNDISEHVEMAGWGVEEAEKANKSNASLATQLALAYAIHKSFIFIRVPITVAITPRVVKTLRGWGWDIGKRTTKEAKAIKRATMPRRRIERVFSAGM